MSFGNRDLFKFDENSDVNGDGYVDPELDLEDDMIQNVEDPDEGDEGDTTEYNQGAFSEEPMVTAPRGNALGSILTGGGMNSLSGGSLFGGTQQPVTSGGSLFGGTQQPVTSGGSLFGGTQQPVTSGGSLFGGTQQRVTSGGS